MIQKKTTVEDINYQLMCPLLNDTFYVVTDGLNEYEVTLVEVKKSKPVMPVQHSWQKPDQTSTTEKDVRESPVVLVFRFPLETVRAQGMYCFKHPKAGVFEEFFLTPIAVDAEGCYLEAVFT